LLNRFDRVGVRPPRSRRQNGRGAASKVGLGSAPRTSRSDTPLGVERSNVGVSDILDLVVIVRNTTLSLLELLVLGSNRLKVRVTANMAGPRAEDVSFAVAQYAGVLGLGLTVG
jgi:hypothetical protein